MVSIEFMDVQKTRLALEEKPKAFLERMCSDVRKGIKAEIKELLPATFFFVV